MGLAKSMCIHRIVYIGTEYNKKHADVSLTTMGRHIGVFVLNNVSTHCIIYNNTTVSLGLPDT